MVSVVIPTVDTKVSFRPKTVDTPIVFFEDGKLFFDLARGVCFDEANH